MKRPPEETYSPSLTYTQTAVDGRTRIGLIAYAISDESTGLASVDEDTGVITDVTKAGTIIIIATKAEDDNYNEATATYELTNK